MKKYLSSWLLAFALLACNSPEEILSPKITPEKSVKDFIKTLGFNEVDIVDIGTSYLVEGDIVFPKTLVAPKLDSNNSKGGRTKQSYTGVLVGAANQSNIRILIDASMSSMTSEIATAIGQYNDSPNSMIHFNIVSSGSSDIYIKNTDLSYLGNVCGRSEFAHNNLAGTLIEIDKNYISANSYDQRQRTIAHELGHSIGLRHTNWYFTENQIITKMAIRTMLLMFQVQEVQMHILL